ncbi:MAG: hypothetical protein KDH20_02295 [Rhodocyclaceae bacterium]|nr:hypothetical protein [Rhodocyclaceae bacterium]
MRSVINRVCLGVAALSMAPAVFAQSAFDKDWACWYQGAGKLNCLLLKASSNLQDPPTDPVGNSTPIPEEARLILGGDESLYSSLVEIPLMNDPYDMLLVEQLARFTVCGDAIDCRMTFVSTEQELALLQASVTDQP